MSDNYTGRLIAANIAHEIPQLNEDGWETMMRIIEMFETDKLEQLGNRFMACGKHLVRVAQQGANDESSHISK